MDDRETYRNTLKYALAIAGSERALSIHLRVPATKLQIWLKGGEQIPTDVFLAAVDVIVAATPADIARSREAMR